MYIQPFRAIAFISKIIRKYQIDQKIYHCQWLSLSSISHWAIVNNSPIWRLGKAHCQRQSPSGSNLPLKKEALVTLTRALRILRINDNQDRAYSCKVSENSSPQTPSHCDSNQQVSEKFTQFSISSQCFIFLTASEK
jgi:hypothetical protein